MDIQPKPDLGQNKLVLLYLLNQTGAPLSELQLIRVLSDLSIMNYFGYKEALTELLQNGHAEASNAEHARMYGITDSGANLIRVMSRELRASYKEDIDEYLAQNKESLILETQIVSDYIKIDGDEYRVILKILDRERTMFEINYVTSTQSEAERICANWAADAVEMFKDMILRLNEKR